MNRWGWLSGHSGELRNPANEPSFRRMPESIRFVALSTSTGSPLFMLHSPSGVTSNGFVRLRRRPSHFLLSRQEKVTKEKATRAPRGFAVPCAARWQPAGT